MPQTLKGPNRLRRCPSEAIQPSTVLCAMTGRAKPDETAKFSAKLWQTRPRNGEKKTGEQLKDMKPQMANLRQVKIGKRGWQAVRQSKYSLNLYKNGEKKSSNTAFKAWYRLNMAQSTQN